MKNKNCKKCKHAVEKCPQVLHPFLQILVVWTLHLMTAKSFQIPWYRAGIFRKSSEGAASLSKNQVVLQNYALFTREQLNKLPKSDISATQKRMYLESRRMGTWIRRILFIRTNAQAQKVLFWLYRKIEITMQGICPGDVTVTSCYFSHYYTPDFCRIMSAMDQGMFAGIFGGGKFTFESRITEGHACCQAHFTKS